jgi:hypothetical protein
MRKLCTDEVRGKNAFCNFKKHIFFAALYCLLLWLRISKMIYKAWEGTPIPFEITQNGEELRKICQKVFGDRRAFDDGPVYPNQLG